MSCSGGTCSAEEKLIVGKSTCLTVNILSQKTGEPIDPDNISIIIKYASGTIRTFALGTDPEIAQSTDENGANITGQYEVTYAWTEEGEAVWGARIIGGVASVESTNAYIYPDPLS